MSGKQVLELYRYSYMKRRRKLTGGWRIDRVRNPWRCTDFQAVENYRMYSSSQKSVSKTSACLAEQFVYDDSTI